MHKYGVFTIMLVPTNNLLSISIPTGLFEKMPHSVWEYAFFTCTV